MKLLDLGDELIRKLFPFIDTVSLLRLGMTCRRLRILTLDERIWEARGKAVFAYLTNIRTVWRIAVLRRTYLLCEECGFQRGCFWREHNKTLCSKCKAKSCYHMIAKTRAKRQYGLTDKDLLLLEDFSDSKLYHSYRLRDVEEVARNKCKSNVSKYKKRKATSM